jgi:hypothetical protein
VLTIHCTHHIQALSSRRDKVEQHDVKHEHLLRRDGYAALGFARRQWGLLTSELQQMGQRKRAIESLRGFLNWLYWGDILRPGIECTLAILMEHGQIDTVSQRLSLFLQRD